MQTIDAAERRARLAVRHRLAPGQRAVDVVEATESMVCLHATDPSTVYLSAWARADGMAVPDMERALYADRSLVKHLAMRRTLFVFPRPTLSFAQAGASDRVADTERRRLIRAVEEAGLQKNGERWLKKASEQVLAALSDGREATSSELRDENPALEGTIAYGEGKSWGGNLPVGPRVLTTLSAAGRIVRASNDGGWTTSRPRWTSMASWLGEEIEPLTEAEGVAGMVERWLRAFGPGTAADIKWWLGHTLTATRKALADLDAVEVDLDGRTGYVLPDDLEPTRPGRSLAGAPPATRPDHDGVVRARLVPRSASSAAVRHATATPDPPRGGTARSSVAGARPTPVRSSSSSSRTSGSGGTRALRHEAAVSDRVVRRHTGPNAVPLAAVEADREIGQIAIAVRYARSFRPM